jgi:hypothetical protein
MENHLAPYATTAESPGTKWNYCQNRLTPNATAAKAPGAKCNYCKITWRQMQLVVKSADTEYTRHQIRNA